MRRLRQERCHISSDLMVIMPNCFCRVAVALAEVERDLAPLAKHAPQAFGDKLKTLVQLIGVFCRILRSSIKVWCGHTVDRRVNGVWVGKTGPFYCCRYLRRVSRSPPPPMHACKRESAAQTSRCLTAHPPRAALRGVAGAASWKSWMRCCLPCGGWGVRHCSG